MSHPRDTFIRTAADRGTVRRAVAVKCHVVADTGFRLLGTRAVDLSPEGMLVRAQGVSNLGESVHVSFQLPRRRRWIEARATVVRKVHGRRREDWGRAIALRFAHLDPLDRAALRLYLRPIPPPVPARALRPDYASTIRAITLAARLAAYWDGVSPEALLQTA
ncbi:MAG: PilZ domain-containing protein [Myxococcales bacterium]|nr:PilZ domain-containing protein [Myxococcales bacterium]